MPFYLSRLGHKCVENYQGGGEVTAGWFFACPPSTQCCGGMGYRVSINQPPSKGLIPSLVSLFWPFGLLGAFRLWASLMVRSNRLLTTYILVSPPVLSTISTLNHIGSNLDGAPSVVAYTTLGRGLIPPGALS